MKVSIKWLQKYFDEPLPNASTLEKAFTLHIFEVDESTSDILDLDILPNRSADCLCHRGVARELSTILDIPIKKDPLREPSLINSQGDASKLSVEIENKEHCHRYIGAVVRGVKVGTSPVWLKEALESVGQRSINNIVDATNYVMLNIGQPLHAFDANKLVQKNNGYKIVVRSASDSEQITTLSGDTLNLTNDVLIIADGNTTAPLAIAGIKGGSVAEIDDTTTDIIIESASFDGSTVRRTSRKLKLFTDSSSRFQNKPSAELSAYGMRDILALIKEVGGGEVTSIVDEYPKRSETAPVAISLYKINKVLGMTLSHDDVKDVFRRLGFYVKIDSNTFIVTPPFERVDIKIPEDLIEEVGRIIGYDNLPIIELPPFYVSQGASKDDGIDRQITIADQARFRGIEYIKDFLIERGFTEISTQSFAKKGDIKLANPYDKTKPALRTSLTKNMELTLEQAKQYTALVLGPNQKPKVFEIGNIFTKDGEKLVIETSEPVAELPALKENAKYIPKMYSLSKYKSFSVYPFMTRDIALWVPKNIDEQSVKSLLKENAGELLMRIDQFDKFEKDGRVSYAFRLVFQSRERTLTDEEINIIMEEIYKVLSEAHFEVR